MSSRTDKPRVTQRIWGLDAIRFLAATWVVFGHCGQPPLTQGIDESHWFGHLVQGIYGNLFAGVPAVMVFFVISGFCIHYPYRHATSIPLLSYFSRRYLRICIPLVAAVLLAAPFNVGLRLFQNSILWSLLAELIYYTLYPLLRVLRRRVSWQSMLAVSMVLAYGTVALVAPAGLDYTPLGPAWSWLVAAPCWLLGCLMAERVDGEVERSPRMAEVWTWRLVIWALSSGCSVLRFHSPIGYPWTLNLFGIAVFFWLRVEIAAFRQQPGNRFLEWAGQWSYSLYLVHLIAFAVAARIPWPNLGYNLNWLQMTLFMYLAALLFYFVIERPGHWIARNVSRKLG
jgi:peptidoglycan/LPS O-acetylase OafA/YrhL